jgi:hypothetical protein
MKLLEWLTEYDPEDHCSQFRALLVTILFVLCLYGVKYFA